MALVRYKEIVERGVSLPSCSSCGHTALQRFPTYHTPSILCQPIDNTPLVPQMTTLGHHGHDIARLELAQADGAFVYADSKGSQL